MPLRTLKAIPADAGELIDNLEANIWKNWDKFYPLHAPWKDHSKRVCEYIDSFVVKSGLKLSHFEEDCLKVACRLHDVGKVLYKFHPQFTDATPKPPQMAAPLLERSHHIISFMFFWSLVRDFTPIALLCDNHFRAQAQDVANNIERSAVFRDLMTCVAWLSLKHKPVDDDLFRLFQHSLYLCMTKKLGRQLAEPFGKKALRSQEKEVRTWLNGEREISNVNRILLSRGRPQLSAKAGPVPQNRFGILSALLQFGDRLDVSYERLDLRRFRWAVLLDELGVSARKHEFPTAVDMARWYQFYFTEPPTIKGEKAGKGIRVIIPYVYPMSLKDDFVYFRYQAEKDFDDLGILSVLEEALRTQHRDRRYAVTMRRSEAVRDGSERETARHEIKKCRHKGIHSVDVPMWRLTYCLLHACRDLQEGTERSDTIELLEAFGVSFDRGQLRKSLPCETRTRSYRKPRDCWLACLVQMAVSAQSTTDVIREAAAPSCEPILHLVCRYAANEKRPKGLSKNEKELWTALVCIAGMDEERPTMGLSLRAERGLEEWKRTVAGRISVSSAEERKVLYRSGAHSSHPIPASVDVAYVLSLFRRFPGDVFGIDDLVKATGLDTGRLLKQCGRLEHEGYLRVDAKQGTYEINPDRLDDIEAILSSFDENPAELMARIHDIELLGKPLALPAEPPPDRLGTGIDGLDKVLSPVGNAGGIPTGKSVLVLGAPGTGKTTLAMQILAATIENRAPYASAMYFTFQEDVRQLHSDLGEFKWMTDRVAKIIHSLCTLRRDEVLHNPDKFLQRFLDILDQGTPEIVTLDTLGQLLHGAPPAEGREILSRVLRVFSVRNITALLIGEEIAERPNYEAFDVDGLLHLVNDHGRRWLEITKLRGCEYAGGRHGFKIESSSERKESIGGKGRGIVVFPNIKYHVDRARRLGETKPTVGPPILSGVPGLDDLLPYGPEGKERGHGRGDTVLVLGSPGSGKTVLGLQFLREGIRTWAKRGTAEVEGKQGENERDGMEGADEQGENEVGKGQVTKGNGERVLWVSFEGDLSSLDLATRGFDLKATEFDKVLEELGKPEDDSDKRAGFRYFAPGEAGPEEVVDYLLTSCGDASSEDIDKEGGGDHRVDRLVLDSVNDLEVAMGTDTDFRSFINSLAYLLRTKGVTTLFLYRTSEFFGKMEDIGRALASVVDTIVCLKVLEIQNRIHKGLFLLKVRGREHRSDLLTVEFDQRLGMEVRARGWTMSGLLSGETGEIREPHVFVKLFYENPNEKLLNWLIVREYNRRFQGAQTKFTHVRKPQIYSEFWSFRGSSGAGHANVRVVSLSDYWTSLFQNEGKLHDLTDYLPVPTRMLVRRDVFWRRCATYDRERRTFRFYAVPNYADIGVLAFYKDNIKGFAPVWAKLEIRITGKGEKERQENLKRKLWELNWNNLETLLESTRTKEVLAELNKTRKKLGSGPRYLFAMPGLADASSFVSFFLELYGSYGGRVFDFSRLVDAYAEYCQTRPATRMFYDPPELRTFDKTGEPTPIFEKNDELLDDAGFAGEILCLVPECTLQKAIRQINKDYPLFVPTLCRLAEWILCHWGQYGDEGERRRIKATSAIADLKEPRDENHKVREVLTDAAEDRKLHARAVEFINMVIKAHKEDSEWKSTMALGKRLVEAKSCIEGLKTTRQGMAHLVVLLFDVFGRTVTDVDLYDGLLKWYLGMGEAGEKLVPRGELVGIREGKEECAYEVLSLMINLVRSGLCPNPYEGDFSKEALLSRKWSGDLASRPEIPTMEGTIDQPDVDSLSPPEALFLFGGSKGRKGVGERHRPVEGRESLDTAGSEKSAAQAGGGKSFDSAGNGDEALGPVMSNGLYGMAPLPACKRDQGGTWSYSVLGTWSLGIMSPAVSPEIGWIFIDAATEDAMMELRSRKGLGLPARTSLYMRGEVVSKWPSLYGDRDGQWKPKQGGPLPSITRLYDFAMQDRPIDEGVWKKRNYRTLERAAIPYYYRIEDIIHGELRRLFEPKYFDAVIKYINGSRSYRKRHADMVREAIKRMKQRIINFLSSTEPFKEELRSEKNSGEETQKSPSPGMPDRPGK